MIAEMLQEIFLPFFGTALGAGCVFFMKSKNNRWLQQLFLGFAAGVMLGASVFSLFIPSVETAAWMGRWAFVPAVVGVGIGILCFFLINRISSAPSLQIKRKESGFMLILAIILHNIPEGMAVGAAYSGTMTENTSILAAEALVLALGIAIQNFPEGAMVSIPLYTNGMKKGKAFFCGMLSGAVEPAAALLTIWAAGQIEFILPYLLGAAAGAMLFVVLKELLPEIIQKESLHQGIFWMLIGFLLMLILYIVL